ncbi:hypothetical protein Nepgr_020585 [Nepenthes gracilis]|uniref:AB hydrolase-1 domain-containing protein n=1 Tax=Nepenthes gracilis TaxID=150966 RepID=A0AAD3SX86_NEPGR|nr:hypothetical protein Nepgr_020585 [Nepenthes gracilis]
MEMLNARGRGVFESLNGTVYGNYSSPNAVVLLHGFGTDQAVWHRIFPVLACFFKVVVFNLAFNDAELYDRNKYSNYSGYADDLIGVLDELDLRNVSYVGHSMAAMIGCIAAVRRPDYFGQLILLGGSPRYLNSEGYVGGFEQAEVDAIFDNISSN